MTEYQNHNGLEVNTKKINIFRRYTRPITALGIGFKIKRYNEEADITPRTMQVGACFTGFPLREALVKLLDNKDLDRETKLAKLSDLMLMSRRGRTVNAAWIPTKLYGASSFILTPFMAPVAALIVGWPTEGTIAAHQAYQTSKKILEMNGCDDRTIKALLSIKFREMNTKTSYEMSPNRPQMSPGTNAIPKITEKTLKYLQNSTPFKESLSATDQLEKVLLDKNNFQDNTTEIFDQASDRLMTEKGWQKVIEIILKETPNLPDTNAEAKDNYHKKFIKKCKSKLTKQQGTTPKIFDKKSFKKLDIRRKAATHNLQRRLSKPNNEDQYDVSGYKAILEEKITPKQWKSLKAEQIEELGKALTENAFPKDFVIDNIDIWITMSADEMQKTRAIFLEAAEENNNNKNTINFIQSNLDLWRHMNAQQMSQIDSILQEDKQTAKEMLNIVEQSKTSNIETPAIASMKLGYFLSKQDTKREIPFKCTEQFFTEHADIFEHMNSEQIDHIKNIAQKGGERFKKICRIIEKNTMHGIRMPMKALDALNMSEAYSDIWSLMTDKQMNLIDHILEENGQSSKKLVAILEKHTLLGARMPELASRELGKFLNDYGSLSSNALNMSETYSDIWELMSDKQKDQINYILEENGQASKELVVILKKHTLPGARTPELASGELKKFLNNYGCVGSDALKISEAYSDIWKLMSDKQKNQMNYILEENGQASKELVAILEEHTLPGTRTPAMASIAIEKFLNNYDCVSSDALKISEAYSDIWELMSDKQKNQMNDILKENDQASKELVAILEEHTLPGTRMPVMASIAIEKFLHAQQ